MRRLLIALCLLFSAAGAYAGDRYSTNIGDGEDCTGRHFRFDGRRALVEEEVIEAGNLGSLKVATRRSPLTVTGGNRGGYTIVACKAAEDADALRQIRVWVENGELRTSGPEDHDDWAVALRVRAPNGGRIDIDTHNGPVAIRDIDATIVARLRNGPLSLDDVGGDIDVTTVNGPISIHDGSGTMKVRASNGPLSVEFQGDRFNGTLDASTKNGPLSITVPRGYGSGVVVETSGRGPISCRGAGCDRWRATRLNDDDDDWHDRPSRIELGTGPTAVRISTVNGPVTIREN